MKESSAGRTPEQFLAHLRQSLRKANRPLFMKGKIAILSYSAGAGRTLVTGQLFNAARKSGINARLFGYDMEKQDWLLSKLLENTHPEPVHAMVPSLDHQRCNFCGNCLRFCSRFAIQFDRFKPEISLRPDRCYLCGDCMKGCSHNGILQTRKQIGNLYQSSDGRICVGQAASGARFILPLFIELNLQQGTEELIICDLPPGDSGFVSTSLMNVSLAILIVIPSPGWEKQTLYMIDYLHSMKLDFCILANKTKRESDFYKSLVELCKDKEIMLAGAIEEFKSSPGIDFQKEFPGSEVFQDIWTKIDSGLIRNY
jgi:MinD superfamily P-loop ATPase